MYKRNPSFRQSLSLQALCTSTAFEDYSNHMKQYKTAEDTERKSNEETIQYNASDNSEKNNLDEKPDRLIQLIQANGENLRKYTEEFDALYEEKYEIYWKNRDAKRQLLQMVFNIRKLKAKIAEVEEKLKQYEAESSETSAVGEIKPKFEIKKSKSADAIKSSYPKELLVYEKEEFGSRQLFNTSRIGPNKSKVSIENIVQRFRDFGKLFTR
jgi:hypothetical protein